MTLHQHILVGFSHTDTGPGLVFESRAQGAPSRATWLIQDREFTLTLDSDLRRSCIGYYNLDTFESFPCPVGSLAVGSGEPRCSRCTERCGFTPFFYNVASTSLSPQQRRYNEGAHVVYLAGFDDVTQKVGIAHADRAATRLHEQGARWYVKLALAANANEARAIEARVSRSFGLSERLTSAKKRTLLNRPFQCRSAVEALEALTKKLVTALHLPATEKRPVVDLNGDYLGNYAIRLPIRDLTDAGTRIGGVGRGLLGDILITSDPSGDFMMSLKDYLGRQVSVTGEATANEAGPPIQGLLF